MRLNDALRKAAGLLVELPPETSPQPAAGNEGDLDKLLEAKRARLETQFANLESVLATLQGQQAALNAFSPVKPLTSTSSICPN